MTKLHKVRAHMRRSPKIERPAAFYRMTELLEEAVRQDKLKIHVRVKAVSQRVRA